jgi:hypothetical protein
MRFQPLIARCLAVLSLPLICASCTSYYKVTDPTTGKTYYTTQMDNRGGGAVTLKDSRTGQKVTVQNSEVKKVNKEEYDQGRFAAQPSTPAPSPAANVAAASAAGAAVGGAAAMNPAQSAAQFRNDLVQAKSQVDRTLGSLSNLTDPNQNDLAGAYKRYSDDVTRMNQHAERLRSEARAMKDARDSYFARWEQKAASTDNPTIRADAEARRDQLRASQDRLALSTGQLRDAYDPFIRDLEEVRNFVGKDLSKDTTSVLGTVTKKAQQDGQVVNQRIDTVIADLDSMKSDANAAPTPGAAGGTGASSSPPR